MKVDFLHGNVILGLISVLVGIVILGLTKYQNLLFIQEEKMGPGFFPVICGIAIVVCGILIFLENYKKKSKENLTDEKRNFNKKEFRNLAMLSTLGIGVIILSDYIGLLPCLGCSVLAYLKVQGKESWKKAILVSICMVIFLYLVFVLFLKVPVPKGLIMTVL